MRFQKYFLSGGSNCFISRKIFQSSLHNTWNKMLRANFDTKDSNDFPSHSDKTWCIFGKHSHFAKSVLSDRKNASTSTTQSPPNSISLVPLRHMLFFSHFLSSELCSFDFKSVFPIVSLENTRKRVLGWWRLAKLQWSQWASAEALSLCECSQRLFIYCRDAGLCREIRKPHCVSSLQRL